MNFSTEPIPDQPGPNTPRFRRKRTAIPHLTDQEREIFAGQLFHKLAPSFDFFLFSLCSGVLISIGLVWDSTPFLIAGALAAPMMAPVIGLGLAAASGSARMGGTSLLGSLLGMALVFVCGVLGGLVTAYIPSFSLPIECISSRYPWDLLLVCLGGVVLAVVGLSREKYLNPRIPSALLAYALYSRMASAGILLVTGKGMAFVSQLGFVAVFLCLSIAISCLLFILSGFRSANRTTYFIPGLLVLAAIILTGWVIPSRVVWPATFQIPSIAQSKQTITDTPSEPVAQTSMLTPSVSPSVRPTITPSVTLRPTVTPSATPSRIIGTVHVDGQRGARLRIGAGFSTEFIQMLDNGSQVILLEGRELKDQVYWIKVQTNNGTIGWMVESFVELATPMLTPSATP
jgi:uncharacterized membrane protein